MAQDGSGTAMYYMLNACVKNGKGRIKQTSEPHSSQVISYWWTRNVAKGRILY
jgi:hypothetical protein